ncbi:LexA family protein [Pantoea ananatis]|uniref:LexA family protein n=1 Tax=Pantoea ananas TaxID=553 RepID=UPI002350038E|nr:hypothetical protein [Pantoea ananatis]MDC7862249.1 hypothetical protein [Pantoea ananatis]
MEQLTDTQQHALEFIRGYIRENGLSPTIIEIAEGMGWKSLNLAVNHINALERKGYLKIKRATDEVSHCQPPATNMTALRWTQRHALTTCCTSRFVMVGRK